MSGFGNDFNFSRMISARNESRSSAASFCRSEEHTSELQSQSNLVCRLLLEKKKQMTKLMRKYIAYVKVPTFQQVAVTPIVAYPSFTSWAFFSSIIFSGILHLLHACLHDTGT